MILSGNPEEGYLLTRRKRSIFLTPPAAQRLVDTCSVHSSGRRPKVCGPGGACQMCSAQALQNGVWDPFENQK